MLWTRKKSSWSTIEDRTWIVKVNWRLLMCQPNLIKSRRWFKLPLFMYDFLGTKKVPLMIVNISVVCRIVLNKYYVSKLFQWKYHSQQNILRKTLTSNVSYWIVVHIYVIYRDIMILKWRKKTNVPGSWFPKKYRDIFFHILLV